MDWEDVVRERAFPGIPGWAINALIRAGYTSEDAVIFTSDQELRWKANSFGVGKLRKVREYLPYRDPDK